MGHHDLISFLGLMQFAGVDLLPIKWQPALENLGMGGSAGISQALVNVGTSFAFKRLFFDGLNTETCFERLRKEALILRHISLINHEHLIRLEAYCCEILKEPERISPVLIFERFPLGNLQAFLLSEESRNISVSERLGFCADIADALAALHGQYIVHGDVKPLNALVFEQDGKRIVKLADLGDASICDDIETLAFLPKSRPWNAPEHHYRGFPFWQAAKMDIYSFGLLCLWVLFGESLSRSAVSLNHCEEDNQTTTGLPPTVEMLAMLKKNSLLQVAAREFMFTNKEITREQQSKLDSFFTITLAEKPAARSSDFQLLLKLLGDDRVLKDPAHLKNVSIKKHWAGFHPTFNLAEYMMVLSHADRRIRVGIVQELIHQYWASECSECKMHVSFQIALSYHTGYGQPRNLEQSPTWLERSGRSTNELESQMGYAKILIIPPARSSRIKKLQDQFIVEVDHAHEHRMVHGIHDLQIKAELAEEVRDIGISFGEAHMMTVTLKRTLARILNDHGIYNEAADMQETLVKFLKTSGDKDNEMKVLADLCHTYSLQDRLQLAERYRLEVADYYMKHLGEEHMGTLGILTNLAHTQVELGQWTKAKENLLHVIAVTTRTVGGEHRGTLAAKSILASVYFKQGQLAEAESLQSRILEARLKTLGEYHESTWYSMSNLAVIRWGQEHFNDAEEMELKVVELRRKFLGSNHPNTLTSMYNLALTYGKNKRLEKEELMLKQVLDTRKIIIGTEHEDTITTAASLARIYQNQRRFEEAEQLESDVVRVRSDKFGKSHPSVLASKTNLMWILHDRERLEQAEAVQIENIAAGKSERGESDVNVLKCMSALASMYKVQRRLLESFALYEQVLQIRIDFLGKNHGDTSKTARDVETVKNLLAVQDEAVTKGN